MKKIIYFLLILPTLLAAQQIPQLETFSLKNGLKVYFLKYGTIEAMNVKVVINSGKKNETPGQQGYNGLVADLIMQGNKKYSEEDQDDKAFAIGAEFRCGADFDHTRISANFLSKDANTGFDLISAAVLQPLFNKDKVDQQISQTIDYNNPAKMDIAYMAYIYSNLNIYGLDHPLGRTYYKKQLNTITVEKLKEFHSFNYTPKNTKIIVTGNFNSTDVKTIIENYFGSWQSAYGETNGVSLDHPSIKKQEVFFANRPGATQCALVWTKNAPAVKDKDALAFTIANFIFNTVLFKEIREKGGKTYSIHSRHNYSQFSNLVNISCSVRSTELFNTIELFDKTLQNFSTANFTQQEFQNQITRFKTELLSTEYPDQIANLFDPIVLDFNKRKNVLNDLNNLKMEEVQKVIKKYYTPGIYKLAIAGDETVVSPQLEKIKNLKRYTPADLELKN